MWCKILILLASLLSACWLGSDGGPYDIETVPGPKPFEAEAEGIVLSHVEQEYPDLEGVEPVVFWTETLCPTSPGEEKTAVVYQGQCYNGFTFDCDGIYVAWRGTIASSAYAHELGHCFRLYLGMTGDGVRPDGGGHLDEVWWQMIRDANDKIRELEGQL